MASVRVIAKARDRIAKFRDAKKMVRASCDAAIQREQAKLPPAILTLCCLAMVHLAPNRCSFSIMAYRRADPHIG